MRYSVIAVVSVALLAFTAPITCADECAETNPEQAFEKSSTVFVGRLIGFTYKRVNRRRYRDPRFRVERQWKGERVPEPELQLWDIPGRGFDLKLVRGRKYLIYATLHKGNLIVPVDCGRSREIKYASKDFEYLSKIQGD